MKNLILALFILLFSISAQATNTNISPADFDAIYKTDLLEATGLAYATCEEIFKQWPNGNYEQRIWQYGYAWRTYPESAYFMLETCNTIWITRYLDPVKAVDTKNAMNHALLSYHLASFDFIESYEYLTEKIRLSITAPPQVDRNIPPGPYEVLSGMASSERQMDLTIDKIQRAAYSQMAATGGAMVAALGTVKTIADFTVTTTEFVGRLAKPVLLATALAWGASELIDYGMWNVQHKDVLRHVRRAVEALEPSLIKAIYPCTRNPFCIQETEKRKVKAMQAPLDMKLNAFFKAVKRLGYFYNYELYVKESNGSESEMGVSGNEKCLPILRDLLSTNHHKQYLAPRLLSDDSCQDPAMVWLAASLYLDQTFPNNIQARAISDKLLVMAKRTLWAYEETIEFKKHLPFCKPAPHPSGALFLAYEICFDRDTGKRIYSPEDLKYGPSMFDPYVPIEASIFWQLRRKSRLGWAPNAIGLSPRVQRLEGKLQSKC